MCCGKQNWITTNKLFHADSFQRKNLFSGRCQGPWYLSPGDNSCFGKENIKVTSAQWGVFYSHLEVKIQPLLWWAAVGEEIEWEISLTPPWPLSLPLPLPLSAQVEPVSGGAHSRHTKHTYRDIYSQKSSWGLDAVTCFRTWCHTQWLYSSTHTREQPDQDNLHTGQQHGTVSGRQQPATRLLLQPGAQPGPSYCCRAVLRFVFETLCFFLNNFPVSLPEERLFLDIPRLKLHSQGLLQEQTWISFQAHCCTRCPQCTGLLPPPLLLACPVFVWGNKIHFCSCYLGHPKERG